MARRDPPITQNQLADAAGLKPTYLGDRLRNVVALDVDDIDAIGRALEVNPVELMQRAKIAVEKSRPAPDNSPRGPLTTPTGGYTGVQDEDDDEMLRRAQHRERSGDR